MISGYIDEMYIYNKLFNKIDYLREIYLVKKALKPYLKIILDTNPEGNIGNEFLTTFLPQLRSSFYYKTAQNQWRDVPRSELTWMRSLDDQSFIFSNVYKIKFRILKKKNWPNLTTKYYIIYYRVVLILKCGE